MPASALEKVNTYAGEVLFTRKSRLHSSWRRLLANELTCAHKLQLKSLIHSPGKKQKHFWSQAWRNKSWILGTNQRELPIWSMIIHRKIQKRSHTILCHNKMQRFMRNTTNWNDMTFQRRGSCSMPNMHQIPMTSRNMFAVVVARYQTLSKPWYSRFRIEEYTKGVDAMENLQNRKNSRLSEWGVSTHANNKMVLCVRLAGDLFLLARSSFFLLSFFSHQNRSQKIRFCWKKRCFRRCPGRMKMKKKKKDENTWKKTKDEKRKKWKKWKKWKIKKIKKEKKTKKKSKNKKRRTWKKGKMKKTKKMEKNLHNNWKSRWKMHSERRHFVLLCGGAARWGTPQSYPQLISFFCGCDPACANVPENLSLHRQARNKSQLSTQQQLWEKLTTKMPTRPFAQYLHQNIELEATPSVKNCVSKIFNIHQRGNWSIIKFNATGSERSIIKLRAMGAMRVR